MDEKSDKMRHMQEKLTILIKKFYAQFGRETLKRNLLFSG